MHKIAWTFVIGIALTGHGVAPTTVGIAFELIGIGCFAAVAFLAYQRGRHFGLIDGRLEREAKENIGHR